MKEIKAFIKSIKLEKVVQAKEIICGNAATPYTADGIIYLSDINDV
jgi:nitrogen regulatory protein PII